MQKELMVVIGTCLPIEKCIIAVYDLSEISEDKIYEQYREDAVVFDKHYLQIQL